MTAYNLSQINIHVLVNKYFKTLYYYFTYKRYDDRNTPKTLIKVNNKQKHCLYVG